VSVPRFLEFREKKKKILAHLNIHGGIGANPMSMNSVRGVLKFNFNPKLRPKLGVFIQTIPKLFQFTFFC